MSKIVNIAAYQFATLSDLKPLRERLLGLCKEWSLKGTILLSTEGVNLFVAGPGEHIESLLVELRAIPGLEKLTPKYSESDDQPFTRMLVRIKKEIIAFGVEGIEPGKRTSPKLTPKQLKQWLDEGRPITLLDTRNDYEVKLGTFKNAVILPITHFRQFPNAVAELSPELKKQPIVMFCTGGIRCEKAGPYMEREGFEQIHQLDGGILKYFEECGGEHYDGECFVFDQRVGVDPSLAESDNVQCFACLSPLTATDQGDSRYVPGESCPYCYVRNEERMQQTIREREAAIARVATPLPGSQAYDNHRPINIPAAYDGKTLLETLSGIFAHTPVEDWERECREQRFLDRNEVPVTADKIVRAGERYLHLLPATIEPDVNPAIRVIYEDEAIVVVEKPAPLPMHPSGRFNRNTLQYILNQVYEPQILRPSHRLDANTTGIVVLARTKHFAGRLQPQFSQGKVEKLYIARIQGHPTEDRFICDAPISAGAVDLGARAIDEEGLDARTEFNIVARLPDGTSIVEAKPITGRTNQIRIHLWTLGYPIVGDQAYLPNQKMGDTQTITVADTPLCLHSLRISFEHPLRKERVTFETARPSWAEKIGI